MVLGPFDELTGFFRYEFSTRVSLAAKRDVMQAFSAADQGAITSERTCVMDNVGFYFMFTNIARTLREDLKLVLDVKMGGICDGW